MNWIDYHLPINRAESSGVSIRQGAYNFFDINYSCSKPRIKQNWGVKNSYEMQLHLLKRLWSQLKAGVTAETPCSYDNYMHHLERLTLNYH